MTVSPARTAPAGGETYFPALSAPKSRLGHGLGQGRKPAAQELRRRKQRIGEETFL